MDQENIAKAQPKTHKNSAFKSIELEHLAHI